MAEEIDVTTPPLGPERDIRPREEAVREEMRRLKEQTRERGKSMAAEQKGKTAQILDDLASALHASARQMNEQTHPTPARYLDRAAENLERFSGALRQRDVDSLLRDVREFARRQPAVMIAGSILAGALLVRLLKSGSESREAGMESTPERISVNPEESSPPVESEIIVH